MSKENLFNKEAIVKLKELSEKARTCMFITNLESKLPFNARPMSLLLLSSPQFVRTS